MLLYRCRGRTTRAARSARLPVHGSCPRFRKWSTITWPEHHTGRRSAGSSMAGCSPGPIAIARWSFFQQAIKSDVADIQGGTTTGRRSSRRDGRQRRPHAAVLHRAGNPRRATHRLSPNWPEKLGVWAFPIHTAVCICTCGSAERRGDQRRPTRRSADRSRMPRASGTVGAGECSSIHLNAAYGTSTIEPTVLRPCRSRCASAASASG